MYNEHYLNLYRDLLNAVKGKDGATAYQFCSYGRDYTESPEKRFVVVGRVINGWENNVDTSLEKRMAKAADSSILGFIDKEIAGSAFWRVTKKVIDILGLSGTDKWYDHLAWNNLYKVAPCDGGNPTEKLFQAQFKACNKILSYEMNALQPRYVLFITGWRGWLAPFQSGEYNRKIELEPDDRLILNLAGDNSEEKSVVIGSSTVEFGGVVSKVVVCIRPERYTGGEEKFAQEIAEAFQNLN
jgi:hypothetical protein